MEKLSVLSFNTLGTPVFAPYITNRYRRTAHLINIGDYDIVCLQEIFTYYHFFIFKKILSRFPYAVYQKNPFGPRGGLVIFSTIPLENPQFVSFSYPQDTYVPLYTHLAQQGVLSAKIKPLGLRIMTTHLSSDTTHNLTKENKLYGLISHQLKEAAKVVSSHSDKKQSLVLAGDFNVAKHSQLYQDFLGSTHLTDVFYKDETPTYYPDRVSYFYRSPKDRCDFIFVKSLRHKINILKTDNAFIEEELLSNGKKSFLSDHIGMHCILEVTK